MEGQLQHSKDQLALDQRPWVGLKQLRNFVLEPGKQIRVEAVSSNTGKSIALNANSWLSLVRDQQHRSLDKLILAATADSSNLQFSNMSLFPNTETFILTYTFDVADQTQVRLIRERKTLLYVIGTFSYQDVFKNIHSTSICLRYDPVNGGFVHCETHNEAD